MIFFLWVYENTFFPFIYKKGMRYNNQSLDIKIKTLAIPNHIKPPPNGSH